MSLATEQAFTSTLTPGPREARPPPAVMRLPPVARVALAHGLYLLAAGGWALRTAGRRRLASGAGACLASIGAAMAAAGARGKVAREVRILGITAGLSLAALELHDAGRSSPLQLVNGAAQLAFAALWGIAELHEMREARRAPEPAFA